MIFAFEGVRVTERRCTKGLSPFLQGDKGDRRVTGRNRFLAVAFRCFKPV